MLDEPQIPREWNRIETIESHTGGEPLRIIVDGFPELEGDTILERRRQMQNEHDDLRSALMWEPRGHADMYGAILTEPVTDQADVGILFTTNKGYSSMCGHGIIALGTALLEAQMLPSSPPEKTVAFDTPAGLVTATSKLDNGRVTSVSFENVPSFAPLLDQTVDVPEIGTIEFDLGYGGAFYAYCDADQLDLDLSPDNADDLSRAGMAIKRAVSDSFNIEHPIEDDLSFLYGTIFREKSTTQGCDSKNVCVFADGQIDRSPTGTGVSGRLAIQHKRGNLDIGEEFVVESIIDTVFRGKISREEEYGGYDAVIPQITGSAHITGRNEFVIDPEDPLRDGFFIR
ncbi:proline racemase family protein [Halobacterium sp. KA-6]|uniref:proline racemase family protein n=1 Tax=Halobacterium sp. KA-6 TaxID=2896368 RepID=UPI001E4377D6|nr:proline racemase family protein [Halobacterium sp. KA-6]MCD2205113.1 proline racemase family protein [Halobacterium sp. KA-6]